MGARVSLERRRSFHDPNTNCAYRVRGQKQWEGLDEVDDLNSKSVSEFIKQDDSFVVPDFDTLILRAGSNQTKIVSVGTANDILLVGVGFTTLDKLRGCLMVNLLVHVDLDAAIPTTSDNGVILATVTDERNFTISLIVLF